MKKSTSAKTTKSIMAEISLSEAFLELIKDLPQRSQDIVGARYGIGGNSSRTLEEIGKEYKITRERVRQITREVFRRAKEKESEEYMQAVGKAVRFAVNQRGGIMNRKELISKLSGGNISEEGAVRFFLDCAHDVLPMEVKGEIKKSYSLKDFDVQKWRAIKDVAKDSLIKIGEPSLEDDIFKEVKKNESLKDLNKKTLFDYLEVSEEIMKNSFGKWGLSKWKEITPKGTREKSFLILKEAGKPLHFREIAKRIDKYKLTKKKAHPQTVHNELIKDDKFVLVGRGIYALADWGYRQGTVKDVIESLLIKAKKPLTREEILDGVLKVRQVKRTTIVINLNNFFTKTSAGKYILKNEK